MPDTPDLPRFKAPPRLDSQTPRSHITVPGGSTYLSNIGDSSPLFDSSYNQDSSPPFQRRRQPKQSSTPEAESVMARERSPAKKPSKPASQTGQVRSPSVLTEGLKAFGDAPRFGETSLPQSPLVRKQPSTKETLEKKILLQPKQVKTVLSAASRSQPGQHRSTDAPIPISRPSQPTYDDTKAIPAKSFGSMGNKYGGFFQDRPTQPSGKPHNFIDLTAPAFRDRGPDPFTFVDPSKAALDLKALLEGAIEDEDDKPRTRSGKKKKDQVKTDDLISKMQGLTVEKDGQAGDDEDDEDEEVDDGTVEGIKVKLLPHQVEGLGWMQDRELGTRKKGVVPKGGILADDMGLGKTLQSISLIIKNPKPSAEEQERSGRKIAAAVEKCTLVVAPLALIRQWEIEIKDKVNLSHSLRVCVHHGPQRTKRFQDLKKYDVVITTYQILVSEWGNSSPDVDGLKTGCFGLHWYRVILDEAHTIKNRNAKATQACYALRSEYRWCLSGTPMQNNLDELQSLIKFLRIKPFDDLKEWKDQIDRPMKNGRGDVAIKRLQHYLKIFMKRRTKAILKKDGALNPGGKPSKVGEHSATGFKVTERRIEKVFAEFTPQERVFYERLESRTDANLEAQMLSGDKVNYASALTMLLRLRQACNHPKLVAGKLGKDMDALAVDGNNAARSPTKKISNEEVDDIADLFGNLGVGSIKCDVCMNPLSKGLSASGAARCEDCEADIQMVSTKSPKKRSTKQKSRGGGKSKSEHKRFPFDTEAEIVPIRKQRNRNVVVDSDDEDAEIDTVPIRKQRNRNVATDSDDDDNGKWLVGQRQRDSVSLEEAGGTDDEDADGTGITLGVEDSDSDDDASELPDIKSLSQNAAEPRKIASSLDGSLADSGSEQDSASQSESEVEDEVQSSDDEDNGKLATIITSTKVTHLLRILAKEADEHKFIVFSQFTSMLDVIEPFLNRNGHRFTRYDGSMKNDLREASLNRLRNDPRCRILLCSLKCGSLGLNLTAATRVVILEPFWNPFVEEQAIDRVHRLTQKTDVIVYKITIKDSVEERILLLQEKKRELAKQAIEGAKNQNAGKLGMQEIMQLFRRDAEHAPPQRGDATSYTLGQKVSILSASPSKGGVLRASGGLGSGSGGSSREGSVTITGERRVPTKIDRSKATAKENDVYGRRW